MASILDRYGIKEVADVVFYELGDAGIPTNPVLYLDTLKVSTIEQTAETTEAKGGKGNAPLIVWDFGKEINVTLEDALFSAKSMAIMFGDGTVKDIEESTQISGAKLIMKTEQFTATDTSNVAPATADWKDYFIGPDGQKYTKQNPKFFDEFGDAATTFIAGNKYFCTYDLKINGSVIEVSANTFPGVYYITGDTFARSEANGKDDFFQFIIPKAKVTSENTITLEAEGDPSVFSMNLRVLRGEGGDMMKLVKYQLVEGTAESVATTATLIHNHNLDDGSGESGSQLIKKTGTITSSAGTQLSNMTDLTPTNVQYVFDKDILSTVAASGNNQITVTPKSNVTSGSGRILVYDKDAVLIGYIDYTINISG